MLFKNFFCILNRLKKHLSYKNGLILYTFNSKPMILISAKGGLPTLQEGSCIRAMLMFCRPTLPF